MNWESQSLDIPRGTRTWEVREPVDRVHVLICSHVLPLSLPCPRPVLLRSVLSTITSVFFFKGTTHFPSLVLGFSSVGLSGGSCFSPCLSQTCSFWHFHTCLSLLPKIPPALTLSCHQTIASTILNWWLNSIDTPGFSPSFFEDCSSCLTILLSSTDPALILRNLKIHEPSSALAFQFLCLCSSHSLLCSCSRY